MPPAIRSLRQEQRELSNQLREQQYTWTQVAGEFTRRYGVNNRAALRMVRDWSQRDAAEQWNLRWPTDSKTFKNISYWELWPSSTGHAPSLDVLARLAELYECSVADLVSDCADFRAADAAYRDSRDLANLAEFVGVSEPSDLSTRLETADVHELARLAAAWASQAGNGLNRRGLLLKLSTAHYLVMRHKADRLYGESLPASNGSRLGVELSVNGSVVTGSWSERTSPTGDYRGSVYHGAMQLVIDPMGKTMRGRWIGFDREFNVDSNTWELNWVRENSGKRAQREFEFKV